MSGTLFISDSYSSSRRIACKFYSLHGTKEVLATGVDALMWSDGDGLRWWLLIFLHVIPGLLWRGAYWSQALSMRTLVPLGPQKLSRALLTRFRREQSVPRILLVRHSGSCLFEHI